MNSLAMTIRYEQSADDLASFLGNLASVHNHHKREEKFSTQELVEYLAHVATMVRGKNGEVVHGIRRRDGTDCLRITNSIAAGILLRTRPTAVDQDVLLDQMYDRYGLGSGDCYSLTALREQKGVIISLSRDQISPVEQVLQGKLKAPAEKKDIDRLVADLTAATGPMIAMGRDLLYPRDHRENLAMPTSVQIRSRYCDSIDIDNTLPERVSIPKLCYNS